MALLFGLKGCGDNMASKLAVTLTESEVKEKTPAKLRKAYLDLASSYNRITENEIMLCNKCNEFKLSKFFYTDRSYSSGHFPVCKECLQMMSEQRDNIRKPVNETKESFQKVLRFMDKPYVDRLFERIYKKKMEVRPNDAVGEISILPNYMTVINSFPQYSGKTWENSEFGDITSIDEEDIEATRIVKSTVLDGKKHFGSGFSEEELMFLETEYKDWISRYECNTKAQEKVFRALCMNELQRMNAIKKGNPTKDLDRTYQDWMDSGNLKPKQNSMDTMSEAQTFGTLIQKYENEKPLPEIDDDFKDIDKIGLYDEVFFRGHMAKALGLKNRFTHIYENFMKQFTAQKPENNDAEDSEVLFDQIFGKED